MKITINTAGAEFVGRLTNNDQTLLTVVAPSEHTVADVLTEALGFLVAECRVEHTHYPTGKMNG